jgi:hypothetical protein
MDELCKMQTFTACCRINGTENKMNESKKETIIKQVILGHQPRTRTCFRISTPPRLQDFQQGGHRVSER